MATLPRQLSFLSLGLLVALGCDVKPGPPANAERTYDKPEAKDAEAAKDGKNEKTAANNLAKTPPREAPKRPKGKQVPAPSDVAAPPANANKTESGLAYVVLTPGSGDSLPLDADTVKVHYTGWTTDGATFDTSDGKDPRSFGVTKVIPGWTEGLKLMHKGEKTRFWIPEALAYKGRAGRPAGMLVFDVELIEILAAPKAPENLAAAPASATKTKGGVAYVQLAPGTGTKHPRGWDRVEVHYSGWTSDGKMFDSSVTRGKPAKFELNRVVPGWSEGIPLMVVGEKARLWIPEEMAYKGKRGPQGQLVFDVELLSIEELPEPPPPPKTPADVAAPPADAKTTQSGLAYKVLKPGKGTTKPTKENKVTVHYSGWTTDGKMFDSSVTRGKPASFPLGRVIAGWTEGLQLMVEGETTRFWIPTELAYNNQPNKPAGMLVFDVELIKIE